MKPAISVFCDGSSHAREGMPGGWAFVIVRDGLAISTHSGGEKRTSNNLMELRAALFGLTAALGQASATDLVELVSDSRFALDIASGSYLPARRHRAEAVALRQAALCARATTRWVRGHSGDRWNELADALAHEAKQALVPARVKRRAQRRAAR